MKITVIGLGYIGLPTAVMFANHNQKVFGVDINDSVVEALQRGIVHIEEPGLQKELDQAIRNGNLQVGQIPKPADAFIISVPTPNNSDVFKSCNLGYVIEAIDTILPYVEKGNTIIVESTIAPRSMEDYIKPIVEKRGFIIGKEVFLAYCPERVLPGKIIHEMIHNNRIIGGMTQSCTEAGKNIYKVFVKGELIETTASAAEMSKLMENTYRDVNIALSNELVKICDHLAINALEVIEMANKHSRVSLHYPGPGVGGHCLAVDPYFVAAKAPEVSLLIQQARKINSSMPAYIIQKVEEKLRATENPKIAVLGLTYKGDIDDIRESPALEIYKYLDGHLNYEVSAYDPYVELDFVERCLSIAINKADLILILTDHSEFKNIKLEDFSSAKKEVSILDTKNIAKNLKNESNYFNLGSIFKMGKNIVNSYEY